jgi:hypothetical protein
MIADCNSNNIWICHCGFSVSSKTDDHESCSCVLAGWGADESWRPATLVRPRVLRQGWRNLLPRYSARGALETSSNPALLGASNHSLPYCETEPPWSATRTRFRCRSWHTCGSSQLKKYKFRSFDMVCLPYFDGVAFHDRGKQEWNYMSPLQPPFLWFCLLLLTSLALICMYGRCIFVIGDTDISQIPHCIAIK